MKTYKVTLEDGTVETVKAESMEVGNDHLLLRAQGEWIAAFANRKWAWVEEVKGDV